MWRLLAVFLVGGLSTGILVAGKFTPDFVVATGTWVGAIATVAAVIWAVESFRRESRRLEHERTAAEEARNEEDIRKKIEQQIEEEKIAAGVKIRCFGGGGSMAGQGQPARMTSIHVEVANGSNRVADIEAIDLPGVTLNRNSIQLLLRPFGEGESVRQLVDTAPFDAANTDFSGNPLTFATPVITYRIDGVLWRREGATRTPERL